MRTLPELPERESLFMLTPKLESWFAMTAPTPYAENEFVIVAANTGETRHMTMRIVGNFTFYTQYNSENHI